MVGWEKKNRIKEKNIWEIKTFSDNPWWWKKLLQIREFPKDNIKHIIGNGQNTLFWWDNWDPIGPLKEKFGDIIIYDSRISKHVKVRDIIENGDWKWPLANSLNLWEVKAMMVDNPNGGNDVLRRTPNLLGKFTIRSTWNELRVKKREVTWAHIVWHKKFIPYHTIILWLALEKRINTRDKLLRFGVITNSTCVLYNNGEEDINHLFFYCEYSAYIWGNILEINNMSYRDQEWERYIDDIAQEWKGNNLNCIMGKLSLRATVYAI